MNAQKLSDHAGQIEHDDRTENSSRTGNSSRTENSSHAENSSRTENSSLAGCPDSSEYKKTPRAPRRILYGIAATAVVSFAAIAAGLVIHGGEEGMKASEVFASLVEFFGGEDGKAVREHSGEAGEEDRNGGPDAENEAQQLSTEQEAVERSSRFLYEAENLDYLIFASAQFQYPSTGDGDWYYGGSWEKSGLCLIRLDGEDSGSFSMGYSVQSGRIGRLVSGSVQQFSVMDDRLYYTVIDDESGKTALYERSLSDAAEERLLSACTFTDFFCGGGKIYYVDSNDGNRLHCYDVGTAESRIVSDVQIGRCDMWGNTIYFEDRTDGTFWKMRLDEADAERSRIPFSGSGAGYGVKVCAYRGSIYLAAVIEADEGEELWLFKEDGSVKRRICKSAAPRFCYMDGYLYYSTGGDLSVHVFDFDAFFDGGTGGRTESYQSLLFEEDIRDFEVTEHFIFVRMFHEKQEKWILIYDRLTGRLLCRLDCWELGQLE